LIEKKRKYREKRGKRTPGEKHKECDISHPCRRGKKGEFNQKRCVTWCCTLVATQTAGGGRKPPGGRVSIDKKKGGVWERASDRRAKKQVRGTGEGGETKWVVGVGNKNVK